MVTLVAVDWASATQAHLLLSDLAVHAQNLASDPRASLLVSESPPGPTAGGDLAESDPMSRPRASMVGRMTKIHREIEGDARAAFVRRHPAAAIYADFGDFSVYRFHLESAHLIAGFGRIQTLSADQLSGS